MDPAAIVNSAVVAAVVSGAVAGAVSLSAVRWQQSRGELLALRSTLDALNRIAMDFPYLESDRYAASWKADDKEDDQRLRYESYCVSVFNLLERYWSYYGGHRQSIEDAIGVGEWVRRHQAWWKYPQRRLDNVRGYRRGFRAFVASYIQPGMMEDE